MPWPALLEQAMADLATKHYTPQTIVHYMKFLRHVFRWAIGRGVIEKSPFASVKLPTVRAGQTRFLSVEEEAQLCQAIGQPYDAWIRLAILTGCGKSEQFGLRWADIDLDRGLITLPTIKSGRVQYIHLTEEAKAILHNLIAGNTSVWVFPSENPDTHLDHHNFYGQGVSASARTREAPRRDLAHLASYVRLTAGDERTGPQYDRSLASAQWDGPGEPVRPPLPYPLARGA